MEIEAKFLLTGRGTYARIRELTHIGNYSFLEGRTESVHDVYLDTTHRELLSAGYACRRRERAGTLLITLKSMAPPHNEVHRREELEVTIPGELAQGAWPDSPAREKVLGLIGQKPLVELFRLSQTRFVRSVVDGDRLVASASLDKVSVNAGGAIRRWNELEVELASTGTEMDLESISGGLRATPGLRPSGVSKFETALDAVGQARGRSLASGRLPAAPQSRDMILLDAPEELSAGLLLPAFAGLGYEAKQRRQTSDQLTFFDTHDGAYLNQELTVCYSQTARAWRAYEGESVKAEQSGPSSAPPQEGELSSALRTVSPVPPSIPYLEAALVETEYDIIGFAAHLLRIRGQSWTFRVPLEEAPRRSLLRFAVTGPSTGLAYFSSLLQTRLGCQVADTPLVRKAFELLGRARPGAPLPAEYRVSPGDTVGRACGRILQGEAWRMRANVRGAIHDLDPEFVHDLRVATRRARSALRLFAFTFENGDGRALAEELGWMASLLGGVRDLDVLTARLEAQVDMIEAYPGFRAVVRDRLHARRAQALSALVPALQSVRLALLLRALELPRESLVGQSVAEGETRDADQPALLFARRRIDKAFVKLGLWIDLPQESMTDSELHRVRILFKRLRYWCEFFRPLLGNDANGLIGSFVGFQDCLGLHQDATTALHVFTGLLADAKDDERSEGFLLSMGAMLQVQRDMQRDQREKFARRWKSAAELIALWKRVRNAMKETQ